MSLPSNNNKTGKQDNKGLKNNTGGSKFIAKSSKAAGGAKKPVKTGGSRGS